MKEPFTKKNIYIFLCLTLAGITLNFLPFTMHYGIDLIFGSIFSLLAVYLLHPVAGVTAATLIALPTIYLWHHPMAVLFFALEAIFLSLLLRKTKKHILDCSAIIWLLLLPPVIYITLSSSGMFVANLANVIILKYMVNGIFNAAIASALIYGLHLKFNHHQRVTGLIKTSEAAANFVVLITALPLLLILLLDSRTIFESVFTNAQYRQDSMQQIISLGIRQWSRQSSAALPGMSMPLESYLNDLIEKDVGVTVLDDHNQVVFSNTQSKVTEKYNFTALNQAEVVYGQWKLILPKEIKSLAMKYWLSIMIVEKKLKEPENWVLITEKPMAKYIERQLENLRDQFSTILALLVFIILSSLLIQRIFSSPLEKLSMATNSIAASGFCEVNVAMPTSEIYEIQTLNENFSAALKRIDQAQQAEKEQNIKLSEANLNLHDKIDLLSKAQNRIEQSEKNLAILLNNSPFSVILADADGRVKYINEEFLNQTRDIDSTNDNLKNIFANFFPYGASGFAIEGFLEKLTSPDKSEKATITGELCMLNKTDPAIFNCIATLIEDRCIVILSDVTQVAMANEEKRRLEEHLQTTQRLESLGILAGGVAHDFNNILQSILGFAELTSAALPTGSELRGNLEHIESAATRAAYLTSQMLAYTGQVKMTSKPFDLTELVKEMTALLTVSVSKLVTIKFNFQESLVWAIGDPTQIRQVTMNMVINASEAIGDNKGQISINTGLIKSDDFHLQTAAVFHGKPDCSVYAYFEVIDSGCGIDDKSLPRIFDPFFTTKFTGRGLGLAATMGIIKVHEGAIFVSSTPDKGSCFRIMLPAAKEAFMGFPESSDAGEFNEKINLNGDILLVDDEETVMMITELMLEPCKIGLLKANNGEEALEIFAREHKHIALVILDMVMPRMKGEVAFKEMKKIDPTIPIIISSGYSYEETFIRLESARLDGFIQKPFRRSSLLQEIVRVTSQASVSPKNNETLVE